MDFFGFQAAGSDDDADAGLGGSVELGLGTGGVGKDDDLGIPQHIVGPPTGDFFPGFFVRNGDGAEINLGMGIFFGVEEEAAGPFVEE